MSANSSGSGHLTFPAGCASWVRGRGCSARSNCSSTNCWWDKSKSQPSLNSKGLVVTAADFASSLAKPPAAIPRASDGSLDLSFFRLAAGSDLLNAGVVPAGALPYDAAAVYSGAPDLGAVESP